GILSKISGTSFKVEQSDGATEGILLGSPQNFPDLPFKLTFEPGPFHREEYILRSADKELYLLGATDLAASHAAYDLLHRLGYRQFFPTETWEIIPSIPNLKISIDTAQAPAFHARRIWYNWGLWGYNNQSYANWCARNRMAQGFH